MKAVSVLYRRLTNAEFNATSDIVSQENGGGQTYFDFPKGSVSDEELLEFFDMISPQSIQNGYEWNFKINNLRLNISQNATISARRASSNSLRNQQIGKESRLKIFNPENGFPTQYDESSNPLVIYIIKDDTNSYWAGWFYPKDYKASVWYMTVNLAQMWDAKKSCGCIRLQEPIIFSQHVSGWTFGKSNSSYQNVSFSTPTTYSHYLTALRTKPFMLLAGISGTGKSRIVRKLAQSCVTEDLQRQYDSKSIENGFDRWQLHKPANFELVQVKPNWHNSLEVVGYKSNIGGAHYEFTPFVRFVARAWQHQDIPFFLCLDEMNLAPVEQYFAEFLSAIESRSIENGEYETDPIIKPFCEFNATDSKGNVTDNLADRMIAELLGRLDTQTKSVLAERFRTKGLTLPKNLFVLGTVNMDETTFSFSRKVLDRAMSIVMNEVKYEQFFIGASENDMDEMSADTMQLLIDREIRGVQAEQNDSDKVESYLNAINRILDNTPFKLGYRAANEALLYVSATHLMSDKSTEEALDEFTLMKILSRIEGDKRSVDTILTNLQEVIDETYPKSNKKLKEMAETLKNKQFVSYWS